MVNISPSVGQIKKCVDGTILEYVECKEQNCTMRYWTNKSEEDPSRNYCVDHQSLANQQKRRGLLSRLFRGDATENPKVYTIHNQPCNKCGGLITWEIRVDGSKPTHVDEGGHIQGDGRCPKYHNTSQFTQWRSAKRNRPKYPSIDKDKLVEYKWYILGFALIITIIELVIIFGIYPIDGPYFDLYTTMFFQVIFKIIGIISLLSGLIVLGFDVFKLIIEKEKTEKKKYRRYLILAIVLVVIGLFFITTPTNSFNINSEFVSFYYTKISNIP